MKQPEISNQDESRRGMLFGIFAYGSWGFLPLYFRSLEKADPLEILAQRIVWAAVFCVLIWVLRREFTWLKNILDQPRKAFLLTIAAYVLAFNWGTYIYAVDIEKVLETSLGYFINPIMMVLVGVLVLGERMSPLQWAAIALATLAVVIITIDYGTLPWIALTLATTFTVYGYIKKTLGGNIGALETMTFESVVLLPMAVGLLLWVGLGSGDLTFGDGLAHTVLLALLGIATIAPLIMFTSAATRLPLTTMGMIQFLAPIGQFLLGAFVFHEQISTPRWIGFGFVWVALVLLTIDSFQKASVRRKAHRASMVGTVGS